MQVSVALGRAESSGETLSPASRNLPGKTPRISVVVPARNEAKNLPHVLPLIPADVHEVILVDGHSDDDTIAVAQQCLPGIKVVRQTRKGKGNALACGFEAVTGDVVVMLDADGSADPAEIPDYVAALVAGADFAKGTRFAKGGSSHDITRLRKWGNLGLNSLVNVLFGTRYTDLCYGYNAFWSHVLPPLQLDGDGFEIETMMNVRALNAEFKITEVPSFEDRRVYGEGRLRTFPDGWRVLKTLFKERLNRRQLRVLPTPTAEEDVTGWRQAQ